MLDVFYISGGEYHGTLYSVHIVFRIVIATVYKRTLDDVCIVLDILYRRMLDVVYTIMVYVFCIIRLHCMSFKRRVFDLAQKYHLEWVLTKWKSLKNNSTAIVSLCYMQN